MSLSRTWVYERSISISLDVLAFEADLDDGFDDDSSPLKVILRGYFSLLIILFQQCFQQLKSHFPFILLPSNSSSSALASSTR